MIFVKNQLNIIYNDLNFEFRRDIKKFDDFIMINSFFINFDDCKYKWWIYVNRYEKNIFENIFDFF